MNSGKASAGDRRVPYASRVSVVASRDDALFSAPVPARAPRHEKPPARSPGAELLLGSGASGSASSRDGTTITRDAYGTRNSSAARFGVVAWLIFAPVFAQAAEAPQGYDAFSLVRTRHIFDPNRRAPLKASEQARPTAPSRPKSVHLTLTGTMVTDGKSLAFFSGSRPEFNKIIGVGDKIGDFTIAAITTAQADLEQAGKPTTLTVGHRIQLEGTEADAAEPEPAAPTGNASAPSPDPSKPAAPTGPAPSGGSPGDILKRMMERRAQEMKK